VHFKLILSLILAGLAVLFVVQNVAVVEVRFLLWGLQMTLSLLIFLLFAGGIIVGWLLHSYWVYRRKVAVESESRRDAAYQVTKNKPPEGG
jgi:lipopolysaccharide assembly protein A